MIILFFQVDILLCISEYHTLALDIALRKILPPRDKRRRLHFQHRHRRDGVSVSSSHFVHSFARRLSWILLNSVKLFTSLRCCKHMTSCLTGLLADARHRPAQNSQKKAVSKERLPDLGRRYEKLSFFISILFLSGNFSFSLY